MPAEALGEVPGGRSSPDVHAGGEARWHTLGKRCQLTRLEADYVVGIQVRRKERLRFLLEGGKGLVGERILAGRKEEALSKGDPDQR